jgi:hypothetical protein
VLEIDLRPLLQRGADGLIDAVAVARMDEREHRLDRPVERSGCGTEQLLELG